MNITPLRAGFLLAAFATIPGADARACHEKLICIPAGGASPGQEGSASPLRTRQQRFSRPSCQRDENIVHWLRTTPTFRSPES